MSKKARFLTILTPLAILFGTSAQGAWRWSSFSEPSATSGTFSQTGSANYDPSDGVNGFGWDKAAQPINFIWSTVGDEPISFMSVPSPTSTSPLDAIEVVLDPDGNGSIPNALTLMVEFPFGITSRANQGTGLGGIGGAMGVNVNPNNQATFDAVLETFDGNGDQVIFDNTYSYLGSPTFSGGNADYGTISNGFQGLNTLGSNQTTYFPFVGTASPSWTNATSVNPAQTIGKQTWTISNIQDGSTHFRLSIDGGVPALSPVPILPQIPEPSRLLLLGAGLLSLALRRRR